MVDKGGGGIALVVVPDEEAMAELAADRVADVVTHSPSATIVLPTGRTPLGFYAELVRRVRSRRVALDRTRLLALDDYAGLPADDHRLLGSWLDRVLMIPAGIPTHRLLRFRSAANDVVAECARMEALARAEPIDLLVLGLGPNGHLGFNEPGSAFDGVTRLVELTPASIASNAVYWGSEADVPRLGYTLGLGTLSGAGRTLLLVAGAHKAIVLAQLLDGPVGPENPSTCLRGMTNVTIIADRAAASQVRAKPHAT